MRCRTRLKELKCHRPKHNMQVLDFWGYQQQFIRKSTSQCWRFQATLRLPWQRKINSTRAGNSTFRALVSQKMSWLQKWYTKVFLESSFDLEKIVFLILTPIFLLCTFSHIIIHLQSNDQLKMPWFEKESKQQSTFFSLIFQSDTRIKDTIETQLDLTGIKWIILTLT